jgi:hypothetical protein
MFDLQHHRSTIDIDRSMGPQATPEKRSLGAAVLCSAIEDYMALDPYEHASAQDFLYPLTAEAQERLDWALSLAPGVNPAWFRSELDRFKPVWDRARAGRLMVKRRAPKGWRRRVA